MPVKIIKLLASSFTVFSVSTSWGTWCCSWSWQMRPQWTLISEWSTHSLGAAYPSGLPISKGASYPGGLTFPVARPSRWPFYFSVASSFISDPSTSFSVSHPFPRVLPIWLTHFHCGPLILVTYLSQLPSKPIGLSIPETCLFHSEPPIMVTPPYPGDLPICRWPAYSGDPPISRWPTPLCRQTHHGKQL